MSPTFLVLVSLLLSARPIDTAARIRPLDRLADETIAAAVSRSPTAVSLVRGVDRSEVVVYVRTGLHLPARGVLTFIACGGGMTYVQVRIEVAQAPEDRVAVLAHELTHALEIAEARPPVCSEAALAALYRRIGSRGVHEGDVESGRAVANERQARADQRLAAALPCAVTRGDPPTCRKDKLYVEIQAPGRRPQASGSRAEAQLLPLPASARI